MWDRKLLKKNAKIAFQRNFGSCVLVCVIVSLLTGGLFGFGSTSSNTQYTTEVSTDYDAEILMQKTEQMMLEVEAFLATYWRTILLALLVGVLVALGLAIVVYNVLSVGVNRYFLENREHKTSAWQIFHNFKGGRYGSTVWVMFLRLIYIWGWTLLFIVPGIIKTYSYMMIPYIMAENPNIDSKRAFQLSQEMMYGHKWEAFKLEVSFLGWILLSSFTGGFLNLFYVNPYMYATYAEFYCALKADARRKGILQPDELPTRLIEREDANA